MSTKTYSEKLRDPRWQKKRLLILSRDNFMCQHCGSESSTLHVHHLVYKKFTDPWDYEDECFISLCYACHEIEESKVAELKQLIHDLTISFSTVSPIISIIQDLIFENG